MKLLLDFLGTRTRLPHALLTLAVSWLIALALPLLHQPPWPSWRSIAFDTAVKLSALVLVGALAWISWRLVGGRISGPRFLIVYSYLSAFWLLVFSLLIAIDEGAIRLTQPQAFASITVFSSSGQDTNKLKALIGAESTYAMKALLDSEDELASNLRAPGVPWILSMAALRGAFTLAWLMVSWGAFRRILDLSWPRAVLSLAIFLCSGLVLALAAVFFQMAPVVVDPNRWIRNLTAYGVSQRSSHSIEVRLASAVTRCPTFSSIIKRALSEAPRAA